MLDIEAITKAKKSRNNLKTVHTYGICVAQTIAATILIAMILWHFLNIPSPEVHVKDFTVDGINATTLDTASFRFNFTLHNPDLYKSIKYDVLTLRITYAGTDYYPTYYGTTVNFNADGKGITQGPRSTYILPIHSAVYSEGKHYLSVDQSYLKDVGDEDNYLLLRVILEAKFMVFNRVFATRQRMRVANLFFDDAGNAFIPPGRGLMLD